jgi:hypothetical protein
MVAAGRVKLLEEACAARLILHGRNASVFRLTGAKARCMTSQLNYRTNKEIVYYLVKMRKRWTYGTITEDYSVEGH